MKLAETVTFGGSGLDRAAHLRADPPAGPVLPIWRGKPLFIGEEARGLVFLDPGHPVFTHATEPTLFLGLSEERSIFARDISAWEPTSNTDQLGQFLDQSEQSHPDLPDDQKFGDLRANMTLIDPRAAELAATGKGLLEWHNTHRFCGTCGGHTSMSEAGWQRICAGCGKRLFPRTDPVVIMLITHGNSVLMGRSPIWPEGMYSLLAGFVEPGETIEAAVRREVFEEAGIAVGPVGYLASQPWPFPGSLMIGCHGHATSTEINIDPVEIENAKWVSREQMMHAITGEDPDMRPARPGSIARFLIENWLADALD